MLDTKTPVRFFMGANAPSGFVGVADDYYSGEDGWRAFLLKGGPGTGKNAMIERVWKQMKSNNLEVEAIVCASDPDSLDGLLIPDIKVCILNSDQPHTKEPTCWGGVEQLVNLGVCLNSGKLRSRVYDILKLMDECTKVQTRCRKFIAAAASLLVDSCRIAGESTDYLKIKRNAARIASREFGAASECKGTEKKRFLSAITPDGVLTFHDTLQHLCSRIYSVEDEYGASSRILIDELRCRALSAGHDVIVCYCPLFPSEKPEHLLIPSLGIGFTTSNQWHKTDFPVYRRIHAARFTDAERLRLRRQLISFNRRAARELISEAVQLTGEAREIRRNIEKLYSDSIEDNRINELSDWLVGEIDCLIK